MDPSREGSRRSKTTGPYGDLSSNSGSHGATTGIVGAGRGRPGGMHGSMPTDRGPSMPSPVK
eukprot:5613819-Prymnesium_polylepis.1